MNFRLGLKRTLSAVSVVPLLSIAMAGSAGSAMLGQSPRGYIMAGKVKPLGSTGQGMKAGTSPSIVALTGGGYEIAFQATTGSLIVYGSVNRNTGLAMMAGTSPAIAAAPGGGFEVAFQSSSGQLVTYSSSSGAVNSGQGMKGGTSPGIAALATGGYETAFQANSGALIVYGAGGNVNTGQGMLTGTSPAIAAASGGGFEAAFQANNGYLYRYSSSLGVANLGLNTAMKAGTSPGISATGDAYAYAIAFQSSTGVGQVIEVNGSRSIGYSLTYMMAGTSPAITTVPSGLRTAQQSNTTDLATCFLSPSSSYCNDTGLGMMTGTSPSIATLAGGSYEIAFQANTGVLYTYP